MFFFFYWSADRRVLHSFPTRRSSDLYQRSCSAGASMSCSSVTSSGACSRSGTAEAACLESVRHRSEEHTSELQSRRDLVCRLLLEKKKYCDVVELARDDRAQLLGERL